jgi:hypothetical protein
MAFEQQHTILGSSKNAMDQENPQIFYFPFAYFLRGEKRSMAVGGLLCPSPI